MILLDTDHLTVLMYPENPRCLHLTHRLADSGETIFTIGEPARLRPNTESSTRKSAE